MATIRELLTDTDELRALAEACETTACHYITVASQEEFHGGPRAIQWREKSARFAGLAKNIRELLADAP